MDGCIYVCRIELRLVYIWSRAPSNVLASRESEARQPCTLDSRVTVEPGCGPSALCQLQSNRLVPGNADILINPNIPLPLRGTGPFSADLCLREAATWRKMSKVPIRVLKEFLPVFSTAFECFC